MLLNVINKNIKAIHSLSGRHGRNIFIFFVTNCITFAIIILSFEDQLMNDVVFVFLQLYYQNLLIFDSFCYKIYYGNFHCIVISPASNQLK